MQETNFYPRYKVRDSSDVLSISLLMAMALLFSFLKVGAILGNIFELAFLVFFIVLSSRLYIRRIVFASSSFLIERYVWPPKRIDYSDIIDLGISKVKTRRGVISFAAMSNLAELHSLFSELIRQGKIDIDQFENKAIGEELVLQKSFWPSAIISAVLGGMFLIYWFYHQSQFSLLDILIVLSLIAVVVSLGVDWIYKKRLKDQ